MFLAQTMRAGLAKLWYATDTRTHTHTHCVRCVFHELTLSQTCLLYNVYTAADTDGGRLNKTYLGNVDALSLFTQLLPAAHTYRCLILRTGSLHL